MRFQLYAQTVRSFPQGIQRVQAMLVGSVATPIATLLLSLTDQCLPLDVFFFQLARLLSSF